MNTGLQDAYNLAWKLALVVKGKADPGAARQLQRRAPAGRATAARDDRQRLQARRLRQLACRTDAHQSPRPHRRLRHVDRAHSEVCLPHRLADRHQLPQKFALQGARRAALRSAAMRRPFPLAASEAHAPTEPVEDTFKAFEDRFFHLVAFGQTAPAAADLGFGDIVRTWTIPADPQNDAELARAGIPQPSFYLDPAGRPCRSLRQDNRCCRDPALSRRNHRPCRGRLIQPPSTAATSCELRLPPVRHDPNPCIVAAMPIRQLSETMINQIAAGEVIERPASVVKELVENALDAGAARVEIATAGGGLILIRVSRRRRAAFRQASWSWRWRATAPRSSSTDIHDIRSLGFRGEALPSIGSVSRLTIRSRTAGADAAAEIAVEGGRVSAGAARRRQSRHVGRGARPVLRHAGAAEIHEGRARRKLGHRRCRQAHRDRLSGVRFTLSGTDRTTLDLPAADDSAGGPAAPHRAGDGRGFPGQFDRHRRRARRRGACRPCLDPVLHARQRAAAICLCQRPAGARQADRRRDPRRLRRRAAARPPCGDRAVPDARSGDWSTSTCIRPRPTCASAIPAWCAG